MSNRSLTSTLRSLGRLSGQPSRLINSPSGRQFCTTPACNVRAIFAETENSELNKILNTIQEKIILPAYLPDKQRKIVFDPTKRIQLEQNPIVIEVEGLEHKFSSLNRFKDIVNSKAILNQALANMESREDWSNLATLLAGYKKAGIRLNASHWGKIVRLAGSNGNIHVVIECAKQSDRTGLVLSNRETAVRVLTFVNEKITNSNRGKTETKQALKWAEIILDLLQRPGHATTTEPTQNRLHFSKLVRGMILFTRASAIQVKQQAGEAVEKDLEALKDDVELLGSLWKDAPTENLLEIEEFAKLNPTVERSATGKGSRIPQALNGSAYVQALAQNMKGISLAREIAGSGAGALEPAEKALDKHLQQFIKTSQSSTEGWAQEYEKIVGKAPNW